MILLLIAMSGIDTPASKAAPSRRVEVSVRVLQGHEISRRTWTPHSTTSQRECIKTEKDGRKVLLRLTEFE